jgi:excisionase family DNA binding protein
MPKGDFGEPASQLVYTVVEAAQALRLSRSKTYELLRNGRLRSVRVDGRRLIRRSDLETFIKGLSEDQ